MDGCIGHVTSGGSSAISAMPPALSHTGPYASMVRPVARVDSIPIAASATPVHMVAGGGEKRIPGSVDAERVARKLGRWILTYGTADPCR